MPFRKIIKQASRLLPTVMLALALTGLVPAPVRAAENPVDLELGGEATTPWVVSGIKPGDSGTKTVELRNVGTVNGHITIWFDEIVNSEGLNPEAETGDTAEPGELGDYLVIDVTVEGLGTNLNLPVTVSNLPTGLLSADYIEVVPINAGETLNLVWHWELPEETGNVVQGDSLTFTTNYFLREFKTTDLTVLVNDQGALIEELVIQPQMSDASLTIEEGTVVLTDTGQPASDIWILDIEKEPSSPTVDTATVGPHYVTGPAGTTFDKPLLITFPYDEADIPARSHASWLYIARWDDATGQWNKVPGSAVHTDNRTVTVPANHFSRYTILTYVPPPLQPVFVVPATTPEETGKPARYVEIDMLGQTFSARVDANNRLIDRLVIADGGLDFTVVLEAGTKITGRDGAAVSRIELSLEDTALAVPDGLLVLSPVYRLTGYGITDDGVTSQINFTPRVSLSIRYDTTILPEFVFLPFVAQYDNLVGPEQLPIAPGIIESGIATGLTDHASLFVVLTREAPTPPELPEEFEVGPIIIDPVTPILEAGSLILNSRQIQEGESVTISITVTNLSDIEGSTELYLVVDGIVRMVKEVTLAAETSQVVTFELQDLAAGSHQIRIAGLTEQFEVIRAELLPAGEGFNWLVIDLSVAAAILVGAFFLYRRTRRERRDLSG